MENVYNNETTEDILDFTNNTGNVTTLHYDEYFDYDNLLKWVVWFYFSILFVGVVMNLFVMVNILQQKKNGESSFFFSGYLNYFL